MTLSDFTDADYLDLLSTGLLVPHYLVHSCLYYECSSSIIDDRTYDQLARRLDVEWGDVRHPHKALIDRSALKSGGSYLRGKYPMRVKQAAALLMGRPVFDR